MSSIYVRDTFEAFLNANSSEKFIDLTARFDYLPDLIKEENLTTEDPWVGLEYVGNDESPITIGANNTKGKYRETGAIYVHAVGVAGLGTVRAVLVRAEVLRNLIRGRRLDRLIIDGMTPVNTDSGSTLNLESGYYSASFLVSYTCDLDL